MAELLQKEDELIPTDPNVNNCYIELAMNEDQVSLSDLDIFALSFLDKRIRLQPTFDSTLVELGLNRSFYDPAFIWSNEIKNCELPRTFAAQYKLIEFMVEGAFRDINAQSIMCDCLKPGRNLSGSVLQNYTLSYLRSETFGISNRVAPDEYWWGREVSEDKVIRIVMEKPIGFSLNFNHKPCAVVSFGVSSPDELMLYQIHGIKPKPKEDRVINKNENRKYSNWAVEPID